MKLDYTQVASIATGAATVCEENGCYFFSRFTDEQKKMYRERTEECHLRSLSGAGIKLSFETDSRNLYLQYSVTPGSSRQYFSFDVFVNGACIGYLDNFGETVFPEKYTEVELPLGRFSQQISLGEGTKQVTVYLPWSVQVAFEEIGIDDGACIRPFKREKTLLSYGDSITQGYDALRPSDTYVAALARALGADETNKGIGGEIFFPELAAAKENFKPDYITVAYGTNDWSLCTKEEFETNCFAFFKNLRHSYPKAKIFAITPLWRTDVHETTRVGKFEELEKTIRAGTKDLDIAVISGLDLVPHKAELFADLFVHPRDEGFTYYFDNLYKEICK